MSIGTQATVASLNQQLSSWALQVRNTMQGVQSFVTFVDSLGATGLEGLGFASADATNFVTMAGYLSTCAGVYYGSVQQGGSGGTGASDFNFNNELSTLWAGQ